MKKSLSIVSLLIVFMPAILLSACGNQNINGTYKMTGLYEDGEDYSDEIRYYDNDDGSRGTVVIKDEIAIFTMESYKEVDIIDYRTSTIRATIWNGIELVIPFSVSNNTLILEIYDDLIWIFEKAE